MPCIGNKEACWELVKTESGSELHLRTANQTKRHFGTRRDTATCMDGILICGHPGREDDSEEATETLGWRANSLQLGDPFLVDIRGDLKPVITPARIPADGRAGAQEPSWRRVNDLLRQAHANAWTTVLETTQNGLAHDNFWRLSMIHQLPVALMPTQLLWDFIPCANYNGS